GARVRPPTEPVATWLMISDWMWAEARVEKASTNSVKRPLSTIFFRDAGSILTVKLTGNFCFWFIVSSVRYIWGLAHSGGALAFASRKCAAERWVDIEVTAWSECCL